MVSLSRGWGWNKVFRTCTNSSNFVFYFRLPTEGDVVDVETEGKNVTVYNIESTVHLNINELHERLVAR